MDTRIAPAVLALALAGTAVAPALAAPPGELGRAMDWLLQPDLAVREMGVATARRLGDRAAVPGLVDALYFDLVLDSTIADALQALTGERFGHDWRRWVEWLEARKDIRPHTGYAGWKGRLLGLVDPRFTDFLPPGVKHRVRLEEIMWGGVRVDGIPALSSPRHVTPDRATYLTPDELVLGLSVGGQHRAYPLRIMDWHEMANDVIAGKPLTIAY